MLPLEERKKVRAHNRKVHAGEVKDLKVTNGTDENGVPLGDDGKPVDLTLSKYAKLGTHKELDGEQGLNGRPEPEGWGNMKVAEKQAWLVEADKATGGGW